jgi:hypothetical protein
MELLDRYLKAIATYLPAAQKDDIVRELSDDIHAKIEDKQAELARPLSEQEIEVILKTYGHPLLVAGRYRQDERRVAFGKQLIGPLLFPFYVKVLQFNLGITSVVLLFVYAVLFISSGRPFNLLSGLPTVFFYQLLMQFAVVTGIFTAVDAHFAKHPDRWDPRKPSHGYYPNVTVARDTGQVPRMESVSILIGLVVWLLWLRVMQSSPFLVLGPTAAYLKFAPVWHELYVPVVVLTFAGMLQATINFVRPDWVRLRSYARLGMGVAGVVFWSFLLKTGPWVVPGDAAANLEGVRASTLRIVNECFYYSLLVAVIVSSFQLLRDLYRLARGTQHRATSRA